LTNRGACRVHRHIMQNTDNEGPAQAGPENDLPDAAPAAAGADPDVVAREREEFRDLLLRKTAEFDNYRKRIERERREQAEWAAADLVKDLLPILDDLERAARADAGDNIESYRKGVELIARRFGDVIARRGVTVIDPLGLEFTPHEHEAVLHEPRPGARDNEVVEVLARGYKLGDRLLRPAMVKVASA
jgi:molecular chaperone GrpE